LDTAVSTRSVSTRLTRHPVRVVGRLQLALVHSAQARQLVVGRVVLQAMLLKIVRMGRTMRPA
jgi:hypothetical protein